MENILNLRCDRRYLIPFESLNNAKTKARKQYMQKLFEVNNASIQILPMT